MSWVSKLKKSIQKELDTRRNLKRAKQRAMNTQRTKAAKSRMSNAGITKEEMKRLRGK